MGVDIQNYESTNYTQGDEESEALRRKMRKGEDVKNQILSNRNQMIQASHANLVSDVFMMVRDARSEENARAIQDSESNTAIEMKRFIRCLVQKDYKMNQIIYEVQKVWGTDILILPKQIEDNRPRIIKYGIPFLTTLTFMVPITLMFIRRSNGGGGFMSQMNQKQNLKSEVFKKLKIKK